MAGAGVVNEKNHCDHCLELRRSLVKTLGEKRLLLLRLQKEQGRIRKLLREGEKARRRDNETFWSYDTKVVPGECTIGRHGDSVGHFNELPKVFSRKQLVSPTLPDREALEKPTARREQSNSRDLSRSNSESGGEHCLEQQLNEVIEVNKKWKEDYDALKLQYETKNGSLQKELDMTKEKLATAETQVLALGSEVTRLATTVNQMYQTEGSSVSSMLDEVFKQQIQVYKEDFSIERRDRERAQSEKDCLQQKLKDAQDIIATLTQEVELYKEQLDETLEKSRRLRSYSDPPQLHNSCPQLQIIYPVNRPPSPSQRQWRQEQRRQGILTRGANHYTAPPSFFYGGEVEVDYRRT